MPCMFLPCWIFCAAERNVRLLFSTTSAKRRWEHRTTFQLTSMWPNYRDTERERLDYCRDSPTNQKGGKEKCKSSMYFASVPLPFYLQWGLIQTFPPKNVTKTHFFRKAFGEAVLSAWFISCLHLYQPLLHFVFPLFGIVSFFLFLF